MNDDAVLVEDVALNVGIEHKHLGFFDAELMLTQYLEQCREPQLHGVALRVVTILKSRIGHSPFDIDDVASELCVSRRTLQRRLREQKVCFSGLRDHVRRSYAVYAVLEGKHRLDDIYTALDFSDRSSLTLAFKRWTGFSPRAFGRLFRDYYAVVDHSH